MQYTILTITALAALAVAAPPEVRRGKKAFTVPQVASGKTRKQAPAINMLKVYQKYSNIGATAPAVVIKAATAAQAGSVPAIPEAYDVSYLSAVTVGSQTLNLNFDTGSADLWVFSTEMSAADQSGHTSYDTSSADLQEGETWSISYGDGSGASGIVYADKVVVGSVTATKQAVEAATSVSSQFVQDTESDGLLGLAFSSINTVRPTRQTTFYDTVESTLALPVFTADLKKASAGTYDFGYIDASKYTGKITYVDVMTSYGYWMFSADGYAVGTNSTVSSSFTAIADTGTTLIYLPAAIVTAYYNQVPGSFSSDSIGGYIFPCSVTLPTFTTVIGGAKFTVPGTYLNYARVSNTYCFGGLQSNAGIGLSIFGAMFIKSQFVVFSQINATPQLGFAAKSDLVAVDEEFEEWYYDCDGTGYAK